MPWMVKPYSRRQVTREERNYKLQDLQGQEVGRECVWNINEQIQDTTGHHGTKAKGLSEPLF